MLAASLLAAALAGQAEPAVSPKPSCEYIDPPSGGRIYYDIFMIFFDWDSSAITPAAAAILDNAALGYAALGHCVVRIYAHGDRSGSAAYNLALSRRRARAIGAYLRQRGITSALWFDPYGESRPLVDTPDGVREPQNRRAEIVVGPPRR